MCRVEKEDKNNVVSLVIMRLRVPGSSVAQCSGKRVVWVSLYSFFSWVEGFFFCSLYSLYSPISFILLYFQVTCHVTIIKRSGTGRPQDLLLEQISFCSRSPCKRYCWSIMWPEHTFYPGLKPLELFSQRAVRTKTLTVLAQATQTHVTRDGCKVIYIT